MDQKYPSVESEALSAFAVHVAAFCELIESRDSLSRESLVASLHRQIPLLYAGAVALPSTDVLFDERDEPEFDDDSYVMPEDKPDPDRLSQDSWWALFKSLGEVFGEMDAYREVLDPYEWGVEEVTGSLADDVVDIYNDLRGGLAKWRRGHSGEALWEWRFKFEVHWGEHASGALRALYHFARKSETLPSEGVQ